MIHQFKYNDKESKSAKLYLVGSEDEIIIPNVNVRNKYTDLINKFIKGGGIKESFQTRAEVETERVTSITNKATETIEATYSPLKQRKMTSQCLSFMYKMQTGGTLDSTEEKILQDSMLADLWIKSIRDIENTAITNGTALIDIVWEL